MTKLPGIYVFWADWTCLGQVQNSIRVGLRAGVVSSSTYAEGDLTLKYGTFDGGIETKRAGAEQQPFKYSQFSIDVGDTGFEGVKDSGSKTLKGRVPNCMQWAFCRFMFCILWCVTLYTILPDSMSFVKKFCGSLSFSAGVQQCLWFLLNDQNRHYSVLTFHALALHK